METTETQILTPAPKINLENVSLKKIAPICKRTFNHINIENFCEFLYKKENIIIPGVKQIYENCMNEPLTTDIQDFLSFIKKKNNCLNDTAKRIPQHETHKIDTFLQKEFLRLQINPEVHNAFVLSLESLSDNDLSRNSEVVSHGISNIQNLPDHVIFTACPLLSDDEESAIFSANISTDTFSQNSSPSHIEQSNYKLSIDNSSNPDQSTNVHEHCYSLPTNSRVTKTDTLPKPGPQITYITKQKITIIDFDNLPISSSDCYFLILSLTLHFWSILYWPLKYTENICDIENLKVNSYKTIQDNQKQLYFYGWVIMSVRKKVNVSSSDNEIKKENLSTILDSLGSDEKTEMLPSPSCKHIFVPKKDTFTFFEYLDTASIKLLHKENFLKLKQNTIRKAIEQLSMCKTLRRLYLEMLCKCNSVNDDITKVEQVYILQLLVEKYMRSRQKTEVHRFNFQPKKMSTTTRGLVKAKCSKKKENAKKITESKITNDINNVPEQHESKKQKGDINPISRSSLKSTDATDSDTIITLEDIQENPCLIIGKKIKHKWKINKKYVHLNGEIVAVTSKNIQPDDSDNEESLGQPCFDVIYNKYKNKVYHYRLLSDIKAGDLQINNMTIKH